MDAFDKPDWLHRFLDVLLQEKLRFIESMKGARFDLVETGGGASSATVISPKLHEEFCLPYDLLRDPAGEAVNLRRHSPGVCLLAPRAPNPSPEL